METGESKLREEMSTCHKLYLFKVKDNLNSYSQMLLTLLLLLYNLTVCQCIICVCFYFS